MASPTLSPYATNGPVRTGRTGMTGDYFNGSLHAKSVDFELCAGWLQYSGLRSFNIVPIITWVEYPTGIVDIPLSGGNPTSSAPAAIWNSYNEPWYRWSAWYPPDGPVRTIHAVELRYYVVLYSSSTRLIVWMSSGSGSDFTYIHPPDQGPYYDIYNPAKNFELSVSAEALFEVNCIERVKIEQLSGTGGEWVYPANCYPDGMGTTRATIDMRGSDGSSSITINGSTFAGELPSGYMENYIYTSERTIEGKAGLYTSDPAIFGWGELPVAGITYTMTGQEVYSSLTEVASMTIGVKEMDLRFRKDQTYQGSDTNCEGNALNNSFNYKAKNSPASASGASVYTHARWTDTGIHYIHEVDFAMQDGYAQSDPGSTAPSFTDIASGITWTGLTSPLIDYDGVWELWMYELDGSIMDSYSPETDHTGTGAHWYRSNPAPTYISLKLNNPEAFNDTASSSIDDHRVQMVYPREGTISWAMASTASLDAVSTIGTLGVGGWTAVDCTLTESGGNLVVTDASSGAYIYRSDFLTDADIRQPKHWPGHRFCQLTAVTPDPFALTLKVKRTGGPDTSENVYSHPAVVTGGGVWDTCQPDAASGFDTAESYIDTTWPLDTAWISGARVNNEYSALSWSWGIGAFDRIEIGGFVAGQTYTLSSLDTFYQAPTPADFGAITYIQQERHGMRHAGNTMLNDEDYISVDVCRHVIGIINGRYAWEAPCTRKSTTSVSGTVTRANYSLKEVFAESNNRWPIDDYSVYSFTLTDDFDSGDWDETLQEYTNERVLFAADVCPVWFCLSKPQASEHDNAHLQTIKIAPLYDQITVYPSWGDGTGVTARTGWVTFKSIKRVRGRTNGIVWGDWLPGVGYVVAASEYSETVTSDNLGYYRTGDHDKPCLLTVGSIVETIYPTNRLWNRVCITLPAGAIWLNACMSRQCGRAYIVYSLGSSLKVRIHDYGNKQYQDRAVGTYTATNSCGICFTAGRKAGLCVVLDTDGTIYRTESFDEGKTWSALVSIVTGTHPQVCYSEKSRVEITTYYLSGNIYCKRKLGDGDYGSAILIASSDESPAAIATLPGTRENKWVCEVVQSGAIVRYVSLDDGKTWSVEE